MHIHGFEEVGRRIRALHFQQPVPPLRVTGWRVVVGEDDVDEGLRVLECVGDDVEDAVDVGVRAVLDGEGHFCGRGCWGCALEGLEGGFGSERVALLIFGEGVVGDSLVGKENDVWGGG